MRLVSPAGANSGLIMAFVLSGRWFLIIIYRLMTAEDEIWVESISRVFGED